MPGCGSLANAQAPPAPPHALRRCCGLKRVDLVAYRSRSQPLTAAAPWHVARLWDDVARASMILRSHFLREHSLSIVVAVFWLLWLTLYSRSDPQTHLGAFFGNSIADWLGTLTLVLITKVFFRTRFQREPPD